MTTKIHQVVDGHGLPLAMVVTGGQRNDGVMLKDVPGARRPVCSTFDAYIDHIVLGPKAAAAYRDGSFEEYTYEETGQPSHLSDHCAISVDLAL